MNKMETLQNKKSLVYYKDETLETDNDYCQIQNDYSAVFYVSSTRAAHSFENWNQNRFIHDKFLWNECFDCNIERKAKWVRDTKREVPFKKNAQPQSIDENFNFLTTKWKNETKGYSLAASKINNNYYLAIIGLGVSFKEKIIKLILEDFKKSSSYWHYALKKITGENPVPKGANHNTQKTREIWLNWGYEKGIITND